MRNAAQTCVASNRIFGLQSASQHEHMEGAILQLGIKQSVEAGARDSHMTLTASLARELHMRACEVCTISLDAAADSKEL